MSDAQRVVAATLLPTLREWVQPDWWSAELPMTSSRSMTSRKQGVVPREDFLRRRANLSAQRKLASEQHHEQHHEEASLGSWYLPNERFQHLQQLCDTIERASGVLSVSDGNDVVELILAALQRVGWLTMAEVILCVSTLPCLLPRVGDACTAYDGMVLWCCDRLEALYDAKTERAAVLELSILDLLSAIGTSGGSSSSTRPKGLLALQKPAKLPYLLGRLWDNDVLHKRALSLLQRMWVVVRGEDEDDEAATAGETTDARVRRFAAALCKICTKIELPRACRRGAARALGALLRVSRAEGAIYETLWKMTVPPLARLEKLVELLEEERSAVGDRLVSMVRDVLMRRQLSLQEALIQEIQY